MQIIDFLPKKEQTHLSVGRRETWAIQRRMFCCSASRFRSSKSSTSQNTKTRLEQLSREDGAELLK